MTTAQPTMYTLRQLRDPLDQAGRRSTCPTDVDPREHTAEAIAQTLGVSRKTNYRSLAVWLVAGPRARPTSLVGERSAALGPRRPPLCPANALGGSKYRAICGYGSHFPSQ
jgi:hypothetical protein